MGNRVPALFDSSKKRNNSVNLIPGPGSYNSQEVQYNSKQKTSPSFSMGNLLKKKPNANPAPGQYETVANTSHVKPRAPSWQMRGDRQLINNDGRGKDTPGVG
jgi:hypothetical protein